MGTSTILYLNPKWEIRDIADVLERTQGKEVQIEPQSVSIVGCFNIFVGDRRIFSIVNNRTPIGTMTYLSLGANEEGKKILRDIAEVLGGLFMDNDYDGKCELITGNADEDDGLPFFLKYAIVKDGIDPKDTEAFLKSMQELRKKLNHTDKGLDELLEKAGISDKPNKKEQKRK